MCLEKFEPDVHEQLNRGEKCKPVITEKLYRDIFNREFNLAFGPATHRHMCFV